MAVAIIHDAWTRVACLYDNTSDTAFGPVFTGPDAGTDAEDFLEWLAEAGPLSGERRYLATDGTDPRHYSVEALFALQHRWRQERALEPSH